MIIYEQLKVRAVAKAAGDLDWMISASSWLYPLNFWKFSSYCLSDHTQNQLINLTEGMALFTSLCTH